MRWLGVDVTSGLATVLWTWIVLTGESAALRIIGVGFGLLALRGFATCVVSFFREPSLTITPDALVVNGVGRSFEDRWDECSDFRSVRFLVNTYVRYQVGGRRRSIPAGFGDGDRLLTASELADVLNLAKRAGSSEVGPAVA